MGALDTEMGPIHPFHHRTPNPMLRLSVVALCAMLLSACDFSGGDSTPLARVSNATVLEAPLQPDGDGMWDPDGAPDLFVEIQDISGRAVFQSAVFENTAILPEGGLDTGAAFDILSDFRTYYVVLIDVDPDGYELMAVSEPFDATLLTASVDGEVTLGGDDFQIKLQLDQ